MRLTETTSLPTDINIALSERACDQTWKRLVEMCEALGRKLPKEGREVRETHARQYISALGKVRDGA